MFESRSQRVFAPVRTWRWRAHRWSHSTVTVLWDGQFAAPVYYPFSPLLSWPGDHPPIRATSQRPTWPVSASRSISGVGRARSPGARPRHPATRSSGSITADVALAQARIHAGRLGLRNVAFEPADLETFVPPQGTGLVTMFDAFHHVLDPAAFVARVARVCDRVFLIEPAGTAFGTWNRRHDLDWIAATVFQIGDRLEFELGLDRAQSVQPAAPSRAGQDAGSPTEHRYTETDLERFFHGFSLDIRGTIAGLEQYGPDPARHSPLRDRLGDAAYQLLVAIDDAMFAEGVDLAAKHWAIFASRDGSQPAARRPVRRPSGEPRAQGLLPAYGVRYSSYEGPDRVRRGDLFQATVRVKNTGWRALSSTDSAPVMASYHWLDATRRVATQEGRRTPLAAGSSPGRKRSCWCASRPRRRRAPPSCRSISCTKA